MKDDQADQRLIFTTNLCGIFEFDIIKILNWTLEIRIILAVFQYILEKLYGRIKAEYFLNFFINNSIIHFLKNIFHTFANEVVRLYENNH
jgi:hypothetical protein